MAITAQEIKAVALKEDDFGHEMRVGAILENNSLGFSSTHIPSTTFYPAAHGGTYKDPVTEKTRQFDFRKTIVRGQSGTHTRRITMAVECKNLDPDFPLVVCGRTRTEQEAFNVFIKSAKDWPVMAMKHDGKCSLYPPNEFVGKSLMRLKDRNGKLCADSDSEIYDKWSQALSSLYEPAKDFIRNQPRDGGSLFLLPIVVVPDNALWSISYDANGMPSDPVKTDECSFFVDHKLNLGFSFVLTHIHFLTSKGLSEILKKFNKSEEIFWDSIFGPMAATKYEPKD